MTVELGTLKRGADDALPNPLATAEAVVRRIVLQHHDRPSLVSDIACRIGAEIVEGVRQPGDDLNSVDLARLYATSRTPVREALMLLEKEGLVEIPPRRRPRVLTYDIRQVREIYQTRGALLALVASEIADHATTVELDRLRELLHTMEAMQADVSSYVWANVEFYETATQIAGNRLVKRTVDSLLLRTLPLRRLSLSQSGRLQKSLDDHIRLFRAFEERDGALAAALMRSNHQTALATLERALARLPAFAPGPED
jgi:DNA-binding GntR family transcriptional regulator